MKILVTGSSGMVGSAVLRVLNLQGGKYEIFSPSHKELDLLDKEKTQEYMENLKPDAIVHAAAKVGGIQSNIDEQVQYILQNTYISSHVIEAALNAGVKNLLNLGSSCMYPKDRALLTEDLLLDGKLEPTNEGYALAKINAAMLCKSISNQYKLNYKTLIPCNLYGPNDNFDLITSHMIPGVIHKIHNAKIDDAPEVAIWGDGTARREFMFVDDLADFILVALENIDQLADMTNIGLGYDHSINEYYQEIAKMIGYQGKFKHHLDKPVGMKQKLLDISRAKKLGWQPKYTLQTGLKKTYENFLAWKLK